MPERKSSEVINIAVDVMGGDYAPGAIIDGVCMTLERYGNEFKLLLVGDQKRMEVELKRVGILGDPRLELVHASQVVEMGDHPVSAVRQKRDSSINVAMNLVRVGRASGVFSAGSTGASVVSAYFRLSMLPGIERPGIAEALARLVASGRFNTVRDLLSEGLNDIHARKMDFMVLSQYNLMGPPAGERTDWRSELPEKPLTNGMSIEEVIDYLKALYPAYEKYRNCSK